MSEPVQIILGIVGLVALFILTRFVIAWKLRSATEYVLRDLEAQGAKDIFSAVELPYAKTSLIRIGMRDYHSKALEYMVGEGVVSKTGAGKYYVSAARESAEQG